MFLQDWIFFLRLLTVRIWIQLNDAFGFWKQNIETGMSSTSEFISARIVTEALNRIGQISNFHMDAYILKTIEKTEKVIADLMH